MGVEKKLETLHREIRQQAQEAWCGKHFGGKGMCKGDRASIKGRELAASTTKGTVIFRN